MPDLEILDIDGLSKMLHMTRNQCYELCRERVRAKMEKPLPVVKLNGNLRFNRESVLAWLRDLEAR